MQTLARWAFGLILLTSTATLHADAAPSLAELARQADFVALTQVRDTDYLRRREIPVSGSAYLRVLIAYKTEKGAGWPVAGSGSESGETVVEVYEQGLREGECYFPNPSVSEEGRRYLVFLRRDPGDAERLRGLPGGCAIDVLVDRANGYAVRMPITGLRLDEAQTARLERLAVPMQFSDPYARVADEDLPPALRDAMLAAGQIVPFTPAAAAGNGLPQAPVAPARSWLYTQGIRLADFRALLEIGYTDPPTRR
jgi:hypothetical protein